MFTWVIIFIVGGAFLGYLFSGNKNGAAEGAATGFAVFMTVATRIVLPILVILLLFRACN
jgi:hypothetical protein